MHRLIPIVCALVVPCLASSTPGAAQSTRSERVAPIERVDAVSTTGVGATDVESHDAPTALDTNEASSTPPPSPTQFRSAMPVEVPECPGTNHSRGAAELETGRSDLHDAQRLEPNPELVDVPAPEVVALYRTALEHFDRACEWLGPEALEWRAMALDLLGHTYEAHVNLLEFLRRTPTSELDAERLTRVELNRAYYERKLVALRVQSTPRGARVEVLERPDLSLRTPTALVFLPQRDTPYEVRISLEGHVPVRRSVSGARGARPELELVLTPLHSPTEMPPANNPTSTHEPRRWTEALTAAGVTAGVALVGAALSHGIAEGRARTFNRHCAPSIVEGCDNVHREYERALRLSIVSYTIAGIASIATAYFAVLRWKNRPEANERAVTLRCSIGALAAAECAFRF